MHSHGRALNGLLPHAVDDLDDYIAREGELISNVVNGWNFGDAHFHGRQLLDAVQDRCCFEPGEVRVIYLESEPTARGEGASGSRSTTPRPAWSRRLGRRRRHGRAPALARRAARLPGRGGRRRAARSQQPPRELRHRRRLGPQRARLRGCARPRGGGGHGARGRRDHRRRHADERAHGPRRTPRPLLGRPPDGRRIAVPELARPRAPRARVAAGPRSTWLTRSTTAPPA